jgi:hypothetical protein
VWRSEVRYVEEGSANSSAILRMPVDERIWEIEEAWVGSLAVLKEDTVIWGTGNGGRCCGLSWSARCAIDRVAVRKDFDIKVWADF